MCSGSPGQRILLGRTSLGEPTLATSTLFNGSDATPVLTPRLKAQELYGGKLFKATNNSDLERFAWRVIKKIVILRIFWEFISFRRIVTFFRLLFIVTYSNVLYNIFAAYRSCYVWDLRKQEESPFIFNTV
jgi:hypothetical protein